MLNPKIKKYLKELDNWPTNGYKEFPSEVEIYREITRLLGAKEPLLLSELKEKFDLSNEDQYELSAFFLTNEMSLSTNDFNEYLSKTFPILGKYYLGSAIKTEFSDYFSQNPNVFNYWEKRAKESKNQLLKFHYLDRILFFNNEKTNLTKEKIIELTQFNISCGLKILKNKNVQQYILLITLKRILYLSRNIEFFETKKIQNIARILFNKKQSFEQQWYGAIVKMSIFEFENNKILKESTIENRIIFFPLLWIFDWLFFNKKTKINFKPYTLKIFKILADSISKMQKEKKNDFSFIKDAFIVMTNYHEFFLKKTECWDDLFEQVKILQSSLKNGQKQIIWSAQKITKSIAKNDKSEVNNVLAKICDFIDFFTKNQSKNSGKKTYITTFKKWHSECLFYLQEIEKKWITNDFTKNPEKNNIFLNNTIPIDRFAWNLYTFKKNEFQSKDIEKFVNEKIFSSEFSLDKKLSMVSFFLFNSVDSRRRLKLSKNNTFPLFFFGYENPLKTKTLILARIMKEIYIKKNIDSILNIFKNKDFFVKNNDIFNNFHSALKNYIEKQYFAAYAVLVTIFESILRYWILKNSKHGLTIFKAKWWPDKCREIDFVSLNKLIRMLKEITKDKNLTNFNQIILGSKIIGNLEILFEEEQLRNRISHSSNIKELQEPHPANWLFQVIHLLTSWTIS